MKTGDEVSHVSSDLTGKIVSISGSQAEILDEFGFSHRLAISELVPRHNFISEDPFDDQVLHQKSDFHPKKKSALKTDRGLTLDLHPQALPTLGRNLKGAELLVFQRNMLKEFLDQAKRHPSPSAEIIHGIGDGVLQRMVYEVLEETIGIEYDEDGFFYHQSGSVRVYFRKN